MRFKVSIVNDHGNCQEETVIANNMKEAIRNLQIFDPKSETLQAKW